MDIRKIKKLVEILEESNLAEIEIHEDGESVRLNRYPAGGPPVYQMPAAAPAPVAAAPAAAPAPVADNTPSDEQDIPEGNVIRSPMVGTYYSSPNPESAPFVTIGQTIKAGDVVCIVEAMKMFNQIESDTEGKVIAILVEAGSPVEYDQPLFIVR